jgi:hypothetical protein
MLRSNLLAYNVTRRIRLPSHTQHWPLQPHWQILWQVD